MNRTCIAFAILSTTLQAFAQQAEVQRTILIRGESSIPGREVIVARVDIAPGATVGRHTHFGDEIGHVQEGDLEMNVGGDAARKVTTGEAFIIPAGKVHSARNIGDGTAHVIVTYVVEKDKPLAVPAK